MKEYFDTLINIPIIGPFLAGCILAIPLLVDASTGAPEAWHFEVLRWIAYIGVPGIIVFFISKAYKDFESRQRQHTLDILELKEGLNKLNTELQLNSQKDSSSLKLLEKDILIIQKEFVAKSAELDKNVARILSILDNQQNNIK